MAVTGSTSEKSLPKDLDESTTRLLHLGNIREDMVDKAQAAIQQLVKELKAFEENSKTPLEREENIDREQTNNKVRNAARAPNRSSGGKESLRVLLAICICVYSKRPSALQGLPE
ncbi:unnamed protein product [Clonostachys rosea]|uniref:Uncharacterized protein n=1 Tax=Bionectria ochroleuca TaxID=29856 RepID=A0ABY6UPL5_BIOOC|nr:unnamed protein product [Clonostachys rosea]